jgi:hypothetical protein
MDAEPVSRCTTPVPVIMAVPPPAETSLKSTASSPAAAAVNVTADEHVSCVYLAVSSAKDAGGTHSPMARNLSPAALAQLAVAVYAPATPFDVA